MTLRNNMLALIDDVNGVVAERGEVVECSVIALLTRKNLFILGDPGQAKTYTIDEIRKRITGAENFVYLLSKQTDEEALFGRIDLSTLIPGNADENILKNDSFYQLLLSELRDISPDNINDTSMLLTKLDTRKKVLYALHGNRPKLITTGKIPDSHIVLLDEIFNCNDGLLNSLLPVLNERRFTNEGKVIYIPVISFFSASNKIPNFDNPEESILRALYDRLELKIATEYIKSRETRLRMQSRKQSGQTGQVTATITLEDLEAMQGEVASVKVPEVINELFDDIKCELSRLDIQITDRKYLNYSPVVQAKAWLQGRDTVEASDLSVLQYYLWTQLDDIPKIQQVLDKFCLNPLQEKLQEVTLSAKESYNQFATNVKANPTKSMRKMQRELVRIYRMLMDAETKATDAEDETAITKTIDELEDISKEAHEMAGFTYVPLSELQELL